MVSSRNQIFHFKTSRMLIIGDVHGKISQFLDLVSEYRERSTDLIIQLGDLGFSKHWDEVKKWCAANNECNLRIIPGNHDDYHRYNAKSKGYVWTKVKPLLVNDVWKDTPDFFGLQGANSIDKHLRTEGRDWFPNEEMSYTQLGLAVDMYIEQNPKYMFSHTCPSSVKKQLIGYDESSRTEQALQVMFELHQPEIHFFGHFHKHVDEVINGTRFICLAELQTF